MTGVSKVELTDGEFVKIKSTAFTITTKETITVEPGESEEVEVVSKAYFDTFVEQLGEWQRAVNAHTHDVSYEKLDITSSTWHTHSASVSESGSVSVGGTSAGSFSNSTINTTTGAPTWGT